jgi:drug/metabolite transporter (DMT)-like permease
MRLSSKHLEIYRKFLRSNVPNNLPGHLGQPKLQYWLEALAVVVIWTAFIVLARFAVKRTFTPYDLMFLRFAFAAGAAALIVVWRLQRGEKAFNGTPFYQMIWLGFFGGVGMTVVAFIAFSYAPAAHGAVLMPGTLPFSSAILGWAILGEKVVGRRLLGLGFILLGIVFMAVQAFTGTPHSVESWKGDLLFPFASSSWAVYMVLSRKWGVKPLDAIVIIPIMAIVLFGPVYFLFLPKNLVATSWSDIVFHGAFQGWFAFMLSTWIFMRVMKVFGPIKTTMLTAWAPVLAAIAAVPLLDEPLTTWVVAGLVAVSIGTVIGVLPSKSVARLVK